MLLKLLRMLVFFQKPSLALMNWSAVALPRGALIPGHCSSSPSPISPTNLTVRYSRSCMPPALWTSPSPYAYLIKCDKEDQSCWNHDNRLDDARQRDWQHFCGSNLWQRFYFFNHWGWGTAVLPNSKGRDESWLSQCLTLPFWLLATHWRLLDEVLTIQRETLQNHQIALHNG